jgi:hypothetical protein
MKKILFILITIITLSFAASSASASFVNGFCKVNKNQNLVKLTPSEGFVKGKDLFVQQRIVKHVRAALLTGNAQITEAFARPRCVVGGKVYKKIGVPEAHVFNSYHKRALAVDMVPKQATNAGWNKLASLAKQLKKDTSVYDVIFTRYSHLHVAWK